MNGFVTQTRPLNTDLSCRVWQEGFLSSAITLRATSLGSQETTSFRSGRLAPSEDLITAEDVSVYRHPRAIVGTHDQGHEFQSASRRLLTTTKFENLRVPYNATDFRLSGSVIIKDPGTEQAAPQYPPKMTENELIVLGGRCIAATRPAAPEAGLANLLGELKRDGLPAYPGILSQERGPSIRNLGSEYLNVEFGIRPLVSDVQKLMKSVVHSAEILRQFKRDSGRIVRRRFSLPSTREVINLTSYPAHRDTYLGLAGSMVVDAGQITTTDLVEQDVWFSGAYSYYLDVGDTLMSKAERYEELANKLLGTRITADVLYNLAPWSWLVDWWTNVGTALSNVSALQQDGLVIRYGYLMRRTVVTRTVRGNPSTFYSWPNPVPISTLYRSERKERWKATPYGFGLNMTGLSARQWAILAALGMTSSPRIAF